MHSFGMLECNVETTLQAYFRQCSRLVNTRDLAAMGATLANRRVNPMTGERAVSEVNVSRVLSVMSTCGMYDYAGEWLYSVGLPAKSGVSGSVRGIAFCEAISKRFNLHLFSPLAVDTSVVRRAYGGDAVRSKRQRLAYQDAALKKLGVTERVLELQGQLRFGSCEVLSRAVAAELDAGEVIILDFRRVSTVDRSVGALLRTIATMVENSRAHLVIVGAPAKIADELAARSFGTLDEALEWRENELLERENLEPGPARIPLAEVEVLHGVDAAFLPVIEAAGTYRSYDEGEMVFNEGDAADRIYFTVAGRVDIVLSLGGTFLRATTFGPGSTFGDMAALYGGTRTAGVCAAMPSVCFELEVSVLNRLGRDRPEVLLQMQTNIARALANRVRQLSDEVRALS